MKLIIVTFISSILLYNVVLDNPYVKEAKKQHRKGNLYLACNYAAKALQVDLNKKDLNKIQQILSEDYPLVVIKFESKIKELEQKSITFKDTNTIFHRQKIIEMYDKLIMLNQELGNVPKSSFTSIKKGQSNVNLIIKDYTQDLSISEKNLAKIKKEAAEIYYNSALKLLESSYLVKAFHQLQIANNYFENYENITVKIDSLRMPIARKYLKQGLEEAKKGIQEKEQALTLFKEGLKYEANYEDLKNVNKSITDELLSIYYTKAKEYLSKSSSIDNKHMARGYLIKVSNLSLNYKDTQTLLSGLKNISFTDKRNGTQYPTITTDNLIWLHKNLDYNLGGSHCPSFTDNSGKVTYKCNEVGRLYNYTLALRVCPSGWRLPTSNEFDKMYYQNREHFRSKQNQAGWYTINEHGLGEFLLLGSTGTYWTSSKNASDWNVIKHIQGYAYSNGEINAEKNETSAKFAYSCRCVREYKPQE